MYDDIKEVLISTIASGHTPKQYFDNKVMKCTPHWNFLQMALYSDDEIPDVL